MLGLLTGVGSGRVSSEEISETADVLVSTLADLGIPVILEEVLEGPTVTMYGLRPGKIPMYANKPVLDSSGEPKRDAKGRLMLERVYQPKQVTVNMFNARIRDLQLKMGTINLRVEAPIEGTDLIGIEIPNGSSTLIPLRRVLEQAVRLGPLAVGLGEGSDGKAVSIDLAKMPHLLIAGATGSGKSVCINTLLASLLVTRGPEELQLLLIDPKRVELAPYEGVPHLMAPVVTDVRQAAPMLNKVIREMTDRYKLLQAAGVRNITTYNDKADTPLPYIVVVIDELADLMMTASRKVEDALCRLAQMGRATGIHLVVATQRPSVDVITGLIKANFPSRISFAVASNTDSRTVLDVNGAEKLLGKGDMLYQAVDMSRPARVQGCFVSDDEIMAVTDHWRSQNIEPTAQTITIQEEAPTDDHWTDTALRAARLLTADNDVIDEWYLREYCNFSHERALNMIEDLELRGLIKPVGNNGEYTYIGGN